MEGWKREFLPVTNADEPSYIAVDKFFDRIHHCRCWELRHLADAFHDH